jgi:hypothetical protein
LWEEIVFIAYHLHWSFDTIADLDHRNRQTVLEQVLRINEGSGAE